MVTPIRIVEGDSVVPQPGLEVDLYWEEVERRLVKMLWGIDSPVSLLPVFLSLLTLDCALQ